MTLSDPAVWAAILSIAVGTYGLRFSFLYLFEYVDSVPAPVRRALQLVPAAVLAALLAPALLLVEGAPTVVGNDRLLAGVVAAAVAWRTENILATVVAGVFVLTVLQQLL